MKLQVVLAITIAAANYGFNIASLLDSEAPDCMEVNNKRVALHGTPDKVKDLYANLTKTYQNSGNLTFDDVKLVYEPKCKTGSHETDRFEEIQCFNAEHSDWPAELPKQFCWCADPITGHPINDTIKEGPINKFECSKSAAHCCMSLGQHNIHFTLY